MSSELHVVLVSKLTRASLESAEPLERVYELCDNAFCQGTFIHEWVYNVKQLVRLLVQYYNAIAGNGHWKKTWVTMLNHHLPKKSILQCVLSIVTGIALKNTENHRWYRRWAHCKFSFLRQDMLHMQHHFLCNINYVAIAASMVLSIQQAYLLYT